MTKDILRPREPVCKFDAMSPTQEALAVQFCAEIYKGGVDIVRLLEMAEALYLAELTHLTPSQTSGYMQAPMEPSPIRSPHSAGVFTKPLTPSQTAD